LSLFSNAIWASEASGLRAREEGEVFQWRGVEGDLDLCIAD